MDVRKAIMFNTIVIVFVVLLGVIVYADFKDDKQDYDKILSVKTDNDLKEADEICIKKDYFKPLCEIYRISIRLDKNEDVTTEDCNKIQFSSVPYYLYFYKERIIQEINDMRETCILNNQ